VAAANPSKQLMSSTSNLQPDHVLDKSRKSCWRSFCLKVCELLKSLLRLW